MAETILQQDPAEHPADLNLHHLAEEVAGTLFMAGNGEGADRLVLSVDGPPRRDLGGWSISGAVRAIELALAPVSDVLAEVERLRVEVATFRSSSRTPVQPEGGEE